MSTWRLYNVECCTETGWLFGTHQARSKREARRIAWNFWRRAGLLAEPYAEQRVGVQWTVKEIVNSPGEWYDLTADAAVMAVV